MSDIVTADDAKLRFRIMHRILGAKGEFKKAHEDMLVCTNPVFRKIYLTLMLTASTIKRNHQRAIVADFGAWLLWILYKDTAYNPISLYVLKELLKDEKWIKSINELAVDTTDDLYVNRWHNTLVTTQELRKKGKLGRNEISDSEKIFVPKRQDLKHAKMHEEEMTRWANEKINEEIRKRKK